jgi:tripartite-type tricarboxylate transporter receptor subunit TctC
MNSKTQVPNKSVFFQMRRTHLSLGALALGVAGLTLMRSGVAKSQPIKVIAGGPARGAAESYARILALSLRQQHSSNVLLDMHFRADGIIAPLEAARTSKEFVNILVASPWLLWPNRSPAPGIGFEATRDFIPIGVVPLGAYVLVTNNKSGFTSEQPLANELKARPVKMGLVGASSPSQSLAAIVNRDHDARMTGVRFANDTDAWQALSDGKVDLILSTERAFRIEAEKRQVKLIAATGSQRLERLGNVPTLAEHGVNNPVFDHGECLLVLTSSGTSKRQEKTLALQASDCLNSELAAQFKQDFQLTSDLTTADSSSMEPLLKVRKAWQVMSALEDPQFHALSAWSD